MAARANLGLICERLSRGIADVLRVVCGVGDGAEDVWRDEVAATVAHVEGGLS